MSGAEMIEACPFCGYSTFAVATKRTDYNYRCKDIDCQQTFDEPQLREREETPHLSGLPRKLAEVEPDELEGIS